MSRLLRGLAGFAFLLVLVPTAALAQYREFAGKVDNITEKQIIVDNRKGDKLKFNKVDETAVEGQKTAWADVKKGDWVSVSWKMSDNPRKAYKVNVMPPKEEAGEDVD